MLNPSSFAQTHNHNTQAPTVLIDQWYNHEAGCIQPENPAWSALVFPRRNQYCLFGGCQAHGVLEEMPGEPGADQRPQRVVFLVNWWAAHPQAIARATPDDVAAGRLAPARQDLDIGSSSGCGSGGSSGGEEEEAAGARLVQFVGVEAPALEEGDVLPVSLN